MTESKLSFKIWDEPKDHGEIKEAYQVRKTVFVDEQGFPESVELDDKDQLPIHFVLYSDDKPIGNVRLIKFDDYLKLSRMAVLKEHRGKGYGSMICKKAIDYFKNTSDKTLFKVESQSHAAGFYESFGFKKVSEEVIIENAPHFRMEMKKGD